MERRLWPPHPPFPFSHRTCGMTPICWLLSFPWGFIEPFRFPAKSARASSIPTSEMVVRRGYGRFVLLSLLGTGTYGTPSLLIKTATLSGRAVRDDLAFHWSVAGMGRWAVTVIMNQYELCPETTRVNPSSPGGSWRAGHPQPCRSPQVGTNQPEGASASATPAHPPSIPLGESAQMRPSEGVSAVRTGTWCHPQASPVAEGAHPQPAGLTVESTAHARERPACLTERAPSTPRQQQKQHRAVAVWTPRGCEAGPLLGVSGPLCPLPHGTGADGRRWAPESALHSPRCRDCPQSAQR